MPQAGFNPLVAIGPIYWMRQDDALTTQATTAELKKYNTNLAIGLNWIEYFYFTYFHYLHTLKCLRDWELIIQLVVVWDAGGKRRVGRGGWGVKAVQWNNVYQLKNVGQILSTIQTNCDNIFKPPPPSVSGYGCVNLNFLPWNSTGF